MKKYIYLLAAILITSSCNTDDVITEELEDHYRAKTTTSVAEQTIVFEYTPAPGQFINDLVASGFDGTQTTAELAVEYAQKRLNDNRYVSLGGFGGYIVVAFDHNVVNYEQVADFEILCNTFDGSSEPGVVWVMQDENRNGQPDDTWYELAGSETGKAETKQNYSVTYFRPEAEGQPVMWRDSEGAEGQIDYLKAYHRQAYYYPAWIKEDSYTLSGTCLKARNFDRSGNGSYWVLPEYDWGYVDNFSPEDRLTDDDNASAGTNANHFDISNAVDANGKAVELKYIDFVKVQCAVNSKSGWLGEVSTEVFGFYDYGLKLSRDE